MRKILIVDDEKDIRDALSKKIGRSGYIALSAGSGKEALDICKAEIPDLILLDIVMPDMSGYDFAKTLKEDKETQDIPLIFQTGQDFDPQAIQQHIQEIGAFDYIMKPYTAEELLAEIKKVIG